MYEGKPGLGPKTIRKLTAQKPDVRQANTFLASGQPRQFQIHGTEGRTKSHWTLEAFNFTFNRARLMAFLGYPLSLKMLYMFSISVSNLSERTYHYVENRFILWGLWTKEFQLVHRPVKVGFRDTPLMNDTSFRSANTSKKKTAQYCSLPP